MFFDYYVNLWYCIHIDSYIKYSNYKYVSFIINACCYLFEKLNWERPQLCESSFIVWLGLLHWRLTIVVGSHFYIRGKLGGPVLVCQGFTYCLDRAQNNRRFWRCRQYKSSKCKARAVTWATCIDIKQSEHTHAPDYYHLKSTTLANIALNQIHIWIYILF